MKIFTENSVKDLKANQYFPNFLRAFRQAIRQTLPAENLLEDTLMGLMGCPPPTCRCAPSPLAVASRCGGVLLSLSADVCSSDDVIAFEGF